MINLTVTYTTANGDRGAGILRFGYLGGGFPLSEVIVEALAATPEACFLRLSDRDIVVEATSLLDIVPISQPPPRRRMRTKTKPIKVIRLDVTFTYHFYSSQGIAPGNHFDRLLRRTGEILADRPDLCSTQVQHFLGAASVAS